jgi:Flp pilus assembly pilin Flp
MKTKSCIVARRFLIDQSGNTAVEYAIFITLLAAAITSTIHGVGIVLSAKLAGIFAAWWILDPLPPLP